MLTTANQSSAERLRQALEAAGLSPEIKEFPEGTRTAADAAAAIGCTVAQIAKSVILRASPSDRVVLALTSGAYRADENKIAAALAGPLAGDKLVKADAEFVRQKTGYAIGGVAPVGHLEAPLVVMDQSLFQHDVLWAAGGTPATVFPITPADLRRITGALIAEVI